jgi:hypothetical protein
MDTGSAFEAGKSMHTADVHVLDMVQRVPWDVYPLAVIEIAACFTRGYVDNLEIAGPADADASGATKFNSVKPSIPEDLLDCRRGQQLKQRCKVERGKAETVYEKDVTGIMGAD